MVKRIVRERFERGKPFNKYRLRTSFNHLDLLVHKYPALMPAHTPQFLLEIGSH